MSGDSFSCHTWGGGATGIWSVEVRDTAKHPTMLRTALATTKNDPAPNVKK